MAIFNVRRVEYPIDSIFSTHRVCSMIRFAQRVWFLPWSFYLVIYCVATLKVFSIITADISLAIERSYSFSISIVISSILLMLLMVINGIILQVSTPNILINYSSWCVIRSSVLLFQIGSHRNILYSIW